MRMQITDPRVDSDIRSASELEPLFRVLIHNDAVTPYDYVIAVLATVFNLSQELAEHITWVAHTTGIQCVSQTHSQRRGSYNSLAPLCP